MIKEVVHPITGKTFVFHSIDPYPGLLSCDLAKAKKRVRLDWCKSIGTYGIKAWFSDRIWIIGGEVKVLM